MCGQVFVYIQSVQAYLSPPIFVAYFAGILWRRANERGALACLGLGYGLGFSRLALEIVFKDWCASGDADGFFGLYICVRFSRLCRADNLARCSLSRRDLPLVHRPTTCTSA